MTLLLSANKIKLNLDCILLLYVTAYLKAAASCLLHHGHSYKQLVLICSRLGNIHMLVIQHVACDCQSQTVIKILLFVSNLPLLCGHHCFSTVPLFIVRSVILVDVHFWGPGIVLCP